MQGSSARPSKKPLTYYIGLSCIISIHSVVGLGPALAEKQPQWT